MASCGRGGVALDPKGRVDHTLYITHRCWRRSNASSPAAADRSRCQGEESARPADGTRRPDSDCPEELRRRRPQPHSVKTSRRARRRGSRSRTAAIFRPFSTRSASPSPSRRRCRGAHPIPGRADARRGEPLHRGGDARSRRHSRRRAVNVTDRGDGALIFCLPGTWRPLPFAARQLDDSRPNICFGRDRHAGPACDVFLAANLPKS